MHDGRKQTKKRGEDGEDRYLLWVLYKERRGEGRLNNGKKEG